MFDQLVGWQKCVCQRFTVWVQDQFFPSFFILICDDNDGNDDDDGDDGDGDDDDCPLTPALASSPLWVHTQTSRRGSIGLHPLKNPIVAYCAAPPPFPPSSFS